MNRIASLTLPRRRYATRNALRLLLTTVLVGCWTTIAAAQPGYVVDATDGPRVAATLVYELECPSVTAKHWSIFVPAAPELPSQHDVKVTTKPTARKILDLRTRRRDVLAIGVPVKSAEDAHRVRVEVQYEATLVRRELRERKPDDPFGAAPMLGRDERSIYLASTHGADHAAPAFVALIDEEGLRRHDGEDDVDLARRVFRFAKNRGAYEYREDIARRATDVCKSWRTDCGGWANWFVAAMRANGVPARVLVGRWARSTRPNAPRPRPPGPKPPGGADENDSDANRGPANQGHVKAEFFAEGVGWAPVDLSEAVQHGGRGVGRSHFGVDRGDFIVLHVDTDFELKTKEMPKREWRALQTPAFWVVGEGKIDDAKSTEDWQVRRLERRRD